MNETLIFQINQPRKLNVYPDTNSVYDNDNYNYITGEIYDILNKNYYLMNHMVTYKIGTSTDLIGVRLFPHQSL